MSLLNTSNLPNELDTKLRILQDILAKKKFALECIFGICENIEGILLSPDGQGKEFLPQMGKEKQLLIEQVLEADEVFQKLFDGISADFETNAPSHKDKIAGLQNSIKEVLELDIKIRAKEVQTKEQMLAGAAINLKKQAAANPAGKNYILEQYKNNTKK